MIQADSSILKQKLCIFYVFHRQCRVSAAWKANTLILVLSLACVLCSFGPGLIWSLPNTISLSLYLCMICMCTYTQVLNSWITDFLYVSHPNIFFRKIARPCCHPTPTPIYYQKGHKELYPLANLLLGMSLEYAFCKWTLNILIVKSKGPVSVNTYFLLL